MSSETREQPKLIAICSNPGGDQDWIAVDTTEDDCCFGPDCCEPWYFVPAPVSKEAPDGE